MGKTQSKDSQEDLNQLAGLDLDKLEISAPFEFKKGIQMKIDQDTGEMQDVPDVWARAEISSLRSKSTIETDTLPDCLRPQAPSQDIIDGINTSPIYIGKPEAVVHNFHVTIDKNAEYGLKGLPPEWQIYLESSGLTKNEIKEKPQEMLNVLLVTTGQRAAQPPPKKEVEVQMRKVLEFKINDPSDDYHFDAKIGKGGQGMVFLAWKKDNKDEQYAIKLMRVKDKNSEYKIKKEIAIGILAKSDLVINFFDMYKFKGCIFLVMEYMDAGNLTKFIMSYMKSIPEDVISYILFKTLKGIENMHDNYKIHRDLKSDNVLLGKDVKKFGFSGRIKLADFGFAIQLTQETRHRTSVVGTPCWMAPELIQETEYNEKVDIWSLGIVALELALGEPPYLREPAVKIMYKISVNDPPKLQDYAGSKKWSDKFNKFVARCLIKDPTERPAAKELLEDPFLKNADDLENQNHYLSMLKNIQEIKKDYAALKEIPH